MIYSLIEAYPFNTADPAALVDKLRIVKESLKHSFYPHPPLDITTKALPLAQKTKRTFVCPHCSERVTSHRILPDGTHRHTFPEC